MTTGLPRFSESFCPSMRASVSTAPPAANGTMIVTVFDGYSCAPAEMEMSAQMKGAAQANGEIFMAAGP